MSAPSISSSSSSDPYAAINFLLKTAHGLPKDDHREYMIIQAKDLLIPFFEKKPIEAETILRSDSESFLSVFKRSKQVSVLIRIFSNLNKWQQFELTGNKERDYIVVFTKVTKFSQQFAGYIEREWGLLSKSYYERVLNVVKNFPKFKEILKGTDPLPAYPFGSGEKNRENSEKPFTPAYGFSLILSQTGNLTAAPDPKIPHGVPEPTSFVYQELAPDYVFSRQKFFEAPCGGIFADRDLMIKIEACWGMFKDRSAQLPEVVKRGFQLANEKCCKYFSEMKAQLESYGIPGNLTNIIFEYCKGDQSD